MKLFAWIYAIVVIERINVYGDNRIGIEWKFSVQS